MNLIKVAILTALLIGLLSCSKENRSLVATGAVPVYKSEETAISGGSSGRLSKGQKVQVIETIDVKHYLIYKVKLPSGEVGYINDGNYELLQESRTAR